MAGDDWVAEVKRWCRAADAAAPVASDEDGTGGRGQDVSAGEPAVGYEAADPPLQARHWPDAIGDAPRDHRHVP